MKKLIICPNCSHKFLPDEFKEHQKREDELAKELNETAEKIRQRINSLHEFNPMLGHRGCRLGIAYPEITEMQGRAIFEATAALKKSGINAKPPSHYATLVFWFPLDERFGIMKSVLQ